MAQVAPASTTVKQYDNLKSLLKNAKGAKGEDLQAHMQTVFNKLILHYPQNALDKFEEVSYLIKKSGAVNPEEFLNMSEDRNRKQVSADLLEHV
jgi:hypothetical protein